MARVMKTGFVKTGGRGRTSGMRTVKSAGDVKVAHSTRTRQVVVVDAARFEAVMKAAEHSGLLGEKSTRIGGRISPALLEQAKRQTGIETDTDLIEFALASVALDDDFGKIFEKVRGTVDPSLKLGF